MSWFDIFNPKYHIPVPVPDRKVSMPPTPAVVPADKPEVKETYTFGFTGFKEMKIPVIQPAPAAPVAEPPKEVKAMAFLDGIKNLAHTFAAWVAKEWTVVYNEAPKVEHIAASILNYAGPALQVVIGLEGGPAAAEEVGKILNDAKARLTAASGLIYDFGATPSVAGLLSTTAANIDQVAQLTSLKNPKSVGVLKGIVTQLGGLATALGQSATPPTTGATGQAAA